MIEKQWRFPGSAAYYASRRRKFERERMTEDPEYAQSIRRMKAIETSLWREKNVERYNAYQREHQRTRNAKIKELVQTGTSPNLIKLCRALSRSSPPPPRTPARKP